LFIQDNGVIFANEFAGVQLKLLIFCTFKDSLNQRSGAALCWWCYCARGLFLFRPLRLPIFRLPASHKNLLLPQFLPLRPQAPEERAASRGGCRSCQRCSFCPTKSPRAQASFLLIHSTLYSFLLNSQGDQGQGSRSCSTTSCGFRSPVLVVNSYDRFNYDSFSSRLIPTLFLAHV
jgi:hypothetical protein